MNAPPLDPLSAISPDDKILLNNCQEKLMNISMESCNLCHEEWFDLGVEDGVCQNCGKSLKFQPSNNMYPGNLLTFQNLLKWKKCLFLQFMHLFSCGRFMVVKPNTLVILADCKTQMQLEWHIRKCFLPLLLNVISPVKRLAIYFMDFL